MALNSPGHFRDRVAVDVDYGETALLGLALNVPRQHQVAGAEILKRLPWIACQSGNAFSSRIAHMANDSPAATSQIAARGWDRSGATFSGNSPAPSATIGPGAWQVQQVVDDHGEALLRP